MTELTLSKSVYLQDDEDAIEELFEFLSDADFEAGSEMSDEECRGEEGFSFFSLNEGMPFTEGDIIELPSKEASVKDKKALWPKGEVHYAMDKGFNEKEKKNLARAMDEYHKKTCIKFIPKKNDYDGQFLRIVKEGGCGSIVGMVPTQMMKGQKVTLGEGCLNGIGTPIHELMHAIGFDHEQSRLDRDNHVKILWDNIEQDKKSQYKKSDSKDRRDLLQYDFSSVMHYHQGDFGKKDQNGKPKNTMQPIKGDKNVKMGNENFSELDLKKIKQLYNC